MGRDCEPSAASAATRSSSLIRNVACLMETVLAMQQTDASDAMQASSSHSSFTAREAVPLQSSLGRRLLGTSLTTTEIIVIAVIGVSGVLLIAAVVMLVLVLQRQSKRKPQVAATPAQTFQEADGNKIVMQSAAGDTHLPSSKGSAGGSTSPQQQQQQALQQQEQPLLLQLQMQQMQQAAEQKAALQAEFALQQQAFGAANAARAAEGLELRARGPTLDASVLVQRLINNGEPEAAATVASAAGIAHQLPFAMPSTMVGYPPRAPVYLPPLQGYAYSTQPGVPSAAAAGGGMGGGGVAAPPTVPYAPPHTLFA